MTNTTIGIAESVFQLHGVDDAGNVILRKKLRRSAALDRLQKLEPCLVGMLHDPKFALNLSLIAVHRNYPPSPEGKLKKLSR
ncbi:MAG: hypothetical protein RJQ02_00040 [Hyphomonas sp.]